MRAPIWTATLFIGGCSLIFDGNDLRGKGGNGQDGGGQDGGGRDGAIDLATDDGPPPSVCGSDGGTAAALKFASATQYSTGITPTTLAFGDLDGDQKLDLIVNNDFSGSLTVLWGDGAGGFGNNMDVPWDAGALKTYTRGMAVGDLNNDQKLDVVAVGTDQTTSTTYRGVYFLGPVVRGTTPLIRTFAAGNQPEGVAIGDATGDGKMDVVTGNWGDDTISVHAGDATGNLAAKVDYCDNPAGGCPTTTIEPFSILIGDFNHDGHPDVVTGNANASKIHLLLGNVAGTLPGPLAIKTFQLPHVPNQVRLADVNRDGKPDLIEASDFGNELAVLINNGDSMLPFPASTGTITAGMLGDADMGTPTTGPVTTAIADFNSDGILDIASGNYEGHNITIFLGKSDGSFALQPMAIATGPLPNVDIIAADFNGDCRPDLAVLSVASTGGVGAVWVLINQSK